MKEYSQNIGQNRNTMETGKPKPAVVKETVVWTPGAQARLRQAERAGVDPFLLSGIRDSLAATAPINNGQRVVTTDQSFQFGLLSSEIKSKEVHPGQQIIRPKGSR